MEDDFFDKWNEIKKATHRSKRMPMIKEGEVWWCAMGKNIGIEINGKNKEFSRPVLIFKKLSHLGFLGVPLTTQSHSGAWYVPFQFKGDTSIAVLSQARTFSTSRLFCRMGTLLESDFATIIDGFNRLYGIH